VVGSDRDEVEELPGSQNFVCRVAIERGVDGGGGAD